MFFKILWFINNAEESNTWNVQKQKIWMAINRWFTMIHFQYNSSYFKNNPVQYWLTTSITTSYNKHYLIVVLWLNTSLPYRLLSYFKNRWWLREREYLKQKYLCAIHNFIWGFSFFKNLVFGIHYYYYYYTCIILILLYWGTAMLYLIYNLRIICRVGITDLFCRWFWDLKSAKDWPPTL